MRIPDTQSPPPPDTNAAPPAHLDVRAIALAAMKEMRQKGESHEMCARWISERVNAAIVERATEAERLCHIECFFSDDRA